MWIESTVWFNRKRAGKKINREEISRLGCFMSALVIYRELRVQTNVGFTFHVKKLPAPSCEEKLKSWKEK